MYNDWYLLGGIVVLAVFCCFFGFGRRWRDGVGAHKARAGFIVSALLALFVGYVIWQKSALIKDISLNYPFPKEFTIDRSALAPWPGYNNHWIFKSSLSTEAIHNFYSEPENFNGWKLVSLNPIRLLKTEQELIMLLVPDDGEAKVMVRRKFLKD